MGKICAKGYRTLNCKNIDGQVILSYFCTSVSWRRWFLWIEDRLSKSQCCSLALQLYYRVFLPVNRFRLWKNQELSR